MSSLGSSKSFSSVSESSSIIESSSISSLSESSGSVNVGGDCPYCTVAGYLTPHTMDADLSNLFVDLSPGTQNILGDNYRVYAAVDLGSYVLEQCENCFCDFEYHEDSGSVSVDFYIYNNDLHAWLYAFTWTGLWIFANIYRVPGGDFVFTWSVCVYGELDGTVDHFPLCSYINQFSTPSTGTVECELADITYTCFSSASFRIGFHPNTPLTIGCDPDGANCGMIQYDTMQVYFDGTINFSWSTS